MRIALSLIILAAVVLATAASALGAPGLSRSAVTLLNPGSGGGSAQLELSGIGKLQLSGRFVVYGEIEKARRISVVDSAGDARLLVDGKSIRFRRGKARARKPKGRFYLQGSKVRVTLSTAEMNIALAGIGKARLGGVGSLRMNGGATLPWVNRWFQVRPGASPPRLRRSRVIRRRAVAPVAPSVRSIKVVQQAPVPPAEATPARDAERASTPDVMTAPLPEPIATVTVARATTRSVARP